MRILYVCHNAYEEDQAKIKRFHNTYSTCSHIHIHTHVATYMCTIPSLIVCLLLCSSSYD